MKAPNSRYAPEISIGMTLAQFLVAILANAVVIVFLSNLLHAVALRVEGGF